MEASNQNSHHHLHGEAGVPHQIQQTELFFQGPSPISVILCNQPRASAPTYQQADAAAFSGHDQHRRLLSHPLPALLRHAERSGETRYAPRATDDAGRCLQLIIQLRRQAIIYSHPLHHEHQIVIKYVRLAVPMDTHEFRPRALHELQVVDVIYNSSSICVLNVDTQAMQKFRGGRSF